MLIAADIGNSTVAVGLFLQEARGGAPVVTKLPSHPPRTARGYQKILHAVLASAGGGGAPSPLHAVIASVVPSLTGPLADALTALSGERPLIVTEKLRSGLVFAVKRPSQVGADRIANAVAAFHIARRPVAAVDFGTATTITVVGKGERFLGGAILPGLHLMARALHTGTAKLPAVPVKRQKAILGRDTATATASGIIYGTAGAVERLIRGMEKELGYRVELVVTGGNVALIAPLLGRSCRVEPSLTFEGLRLLHMLNTE